MAGVLIGGFDDPDGTVYVGALSDNNYHIMVPDAVTAAEATPLDGSLHTLSDILEFGPFTNIEVFVEYDGTAFTQDLTFYFLGRYPNGNRWHTILDSAGDGLVTITDNAADSLNGTDKFTASKFFDRKGYSHGRIGIVQDIDGPSVAKILAIRY